MKISKWLSLVIRVWCEIEKFLLLPHLAALPSKSFFFIPTSICAPESYWHWNKRNIIYILIQFTFLVPNCIYKFFLLWKFFLSSFFLLHPLFLYSLKRIYGKFVFFYISHIYIFLSSLVHIQKYWRKNMQNVKVLCKIS